jgi:hypothetical protein
MDFNICLLGAFDTRALLRPPLRRLISMQPSVFHLEYERIRRRQPAANNSVYH